MRARTSWSVAPLAVLIACSAGAVDGRGRSSSPTQRTPPSPPPDVSHAEPQTPSAHTPQVVQVAAGNRATCALLSDGVAHCWGHEPGAEDAEARYGLQAVSAGPGAYAFTGLTSKSGIMRWHGVGLPSEPKPDAELAGSGFVQVAAGSRHMCALRDDGTAQCWGGELKQAQDEHDAELELFGQGVPPPGKYRQISSGRVLTCAITLEGAVRCWGKVTPDAVPEMNDAIAVTSGGWHACALREGGIVTCWLHVKLGGEGKGPPQVVVPEGRYLKVAAGEMHTCAVREDGQLACWGDNKYGEAAPPAGHYRDVAAGDHHSCAITREDRKIRCWGAGSASSPNGEYPHYWQSIVPETLRPQSEL